LEQHNLRAAQAAQQAAIMADAKAIANALNATLQPITATTAAVVLAAPTVPAAAGPIAPVIFTAPLLKPDLLNYKVTMVKPQSVIVLMLMGAVALATGWQMTGDLASSPIQQANHNVAQIFQADIQRLCSKPNEGEIPAELFWLATPEQQNNNHSVIVPVSLFFGPPTLEELHAIMNSMNKFMKALK
jgi:hypothetical protein